jgi:hypothetical protein
LKLFSKLIILEKEIGFNFILESSLIEIIEKDKINLEIEFL